MERRNELPFEQERVSHIDQKSEVNRDVGLIHAQRNNIDNLRTLDNQKESKVKVTIIDKSHKNLDTIAENFKNFSFKNF